VQEDITGMNGIRWIISQQKKEVYDTKFYSLQLTNGKASGGQIKQVMLQSGLPNQLLGKIWSLSDLDKDGQMGSDEFALCFFLLENAKEKKPLPDTLPENYVPPTFRKLFAQQNLQQNQQNQTNNNDNSNNNNLNVNNNEQNLMNQQSQLVSQNNNQDNDNFSNNQNTNNDNNNYNNSENNDNNNNDNNSQNFQNEKPINDVNNMSNEYNNEILQSSKQPPTLSKAWQNEGTW